MSKKLVRTYDWKEMRRFRVRERKRENAILKKAAAYFVKETWNETLPEM
jgi:hypothetical protein